LRTGEILTRLHNTHIVCANGKKGEDKVGEEGEGKEETQSLFLVYIIGMLKYKRTLSEMESLHLGISAQTDPMARQWFIMSLYLKKVCVSFSLILSLSLSFFLFLSHSLSFSLSLSHSHTHTPEFSIEVDMQRSSGRCDFEK